MCRNTDLLKTSLTFLNITNMMFLMTVEAPIPPPPPAHHHPLQD